MAATVRLQLPHHLRTLAHVSGELTLELQTPVTVDSVIGEIERRFPMLKGTIREHGTGKRRAYVRFFASGSDVSHEPMTLELPPEVVSGKEPFIILGAISGG